MTPSQQKLILSGRLVSLSQAAKNTPYSAEYLGLLARKGKLVAVKIGRDWLTSEDIVRAYLQKQANKHKKMLKMLGQKV